MILGICGSPRSKATEAVLKQALKTLNQEGFETSFWGIKGKNINFCVHCDFCIREETCIFKDDMQELYPLIRKAEAYILATPVYNGGVTAQIKTVMDRTRALFATTPNAMKNKIGIAIAVGGDRIGGQELAIQQIITFFTLNGAMTISGGFFGANLGASFWSQDTLEGVMSDKEGFKSLKKTMNRLILYLKEKEK